MDFCPYVLRVSGMGDWGYLHCNLATKLLPTYCIMTATLVFQR